MMLLALTGKVQVQDGVGRASEIVIWAVKPTEQEVNYKQTSCL